MTLIYMILMLGIIVFIHEFGHFIFAKKAGIYVYEFSIGMGPRIFKFNRKNDETEYSIRLFPIGGYVQMAGEEIEEDKDIPVEKRMQSKTWIQRFLTVIAGIITRLKVIDSVVVIVATVKATAINRRVRNRFLITLRFTILIVITRDNCLSITVLIRNAIAVN